jgi:hypothetical protein
MPDRVTVSDDERARFRAAFLRYADALNVGHYEIIFADAALDNQWAILEADHSGILAKVTLTTEAEADLAWDGPEQTALHEVLHLAIGKMSWLALGPGASTASFMRADEEAVRRIEAAIVSGRLAPKKTATEIFQEIADRELGKHDA